MIVYLIGFILTIILLYISEYKVKSKRKKFLLRVVAVLPLLVISAIRYNVGTDYDKRYVQDYINLSKGIEVTNLEIGFKAIDYMCLLFTKEPFLLFIITSTIILSIIFEVIYKKSINKILSIIIFFFGGYFFRNFKFSKAIHSSCFSYARISIFYIRQQKESIYWIYNMCYFGVSNAFI